ncbi:MAG: hypothetical protein ACRYFL_15205 [Janthinobacterium lividum]
MKPEELMEKMDETHGVLILLGKRIDELAKKEVVLPQVHIPDYSREFEELKSQLTEALKQPEKSALEEVKTDMAKTLTRLGSIGFLVKEMVSQMERLESRVKQLPETVTQTQHHHHLGNKSKWLLASGIVLLLVTSIASGLYYSLYRENRRLHDNDVKFRMVRQSSPAATRWVDSTFYRDPENAEKVTEKLEAQA